MGFVGVPPARRATGYIDDMLAGTTALLATTGAQRIADDGGGDQNTEDNFKKIKIEALKP